MNKIFQLFCLLIMLTTSITVAAQSKTDSPTKVVLGVVNGKAISLPQPEISPEMRKMRLTGSINVKVVIDENGNVISAQTATGIENQEMRKSCEEAALLAKFTPTKLSGTPVKVTGIIVYNFVNDQTNEEKVRIFGISTFLHMFHKSSSSLQEFNDFFQSDDIIKETITEFSLFKNELSPLDSIQKTPLENRPQKIEAVIKAVQNKLNPSELWQFELGENFVEVLYPFMMATKDKDLSKIDETTIKNHLLKIKELCLHAPDDFPKDVLQNLKDLSEFGNKTHIISPENLRDFQSKLEILFETISPDSTNN